MVTARPVCAERQDRNEFAERMSNSGTCEDANGDQRHASCIEGAVEEMTSTLNAIAEEFLMLVSSATNWGQAVQTSVAAGLALLLAGIPKIIGFLVIMLIGWIIASLIAKAVRALLNAIKFDDMAQRAGFAGFVRDMGVNTDASGVLAAAAKWFIRLITLVAAFDALGLPTIASLLNRLLLWIPNLVVALVVLIVGGLIAGALARFVRGATAEAGIGSPNILGALANWAVWGFAILVALNQIGIASTLVNILFMGFVGALALGFALAFGLGGQDTASRIVQSWYRSSQQAREHQVTSDTRTGSLQPTADHTLEVERRPIR